MSFGQLLPPIDMYESINYGNTFVCDYIVISPPGLLFHASSPTVKIAPLFAQKLFVWISIAGFSLPPSVLCFWAIKVFSPSHGLAKARQVEQR